MQKIARKPDTLEGDIGERDIQPPRELGTEIVAEPALFAADAICDLRQRAALENADAQCTRSGGFGPRTIGVSGWFGQVGHF